MRRPLTDWIKIPWPLYFAAGLVGALAGLAGAAFHAVLDQADHGREVLRASLGSAPLPGWLVLMGAGALVLVLALWIVRRFAPETAGSGVQEVEAILAGQRTMRWRRVLPVKFVAGTLAVGSGLVLGREGPTIHMGAALGQMASERMAQNNGQGRTLIAAGAAAGLAAAFNAPLAAIVFVTEELRENFEFSFAAIQSVILACCAAVVVSGWILGQGPDLPIPNLVMAPLWALPLFLILGVLIGTLGVIFNGLLLGSVHAFRALPKNLPYLAAAAVGMALGALLWLVPDAVGGGEGLVESLPGKQTGILLLLGLLAVRVLTSVGSYGVGLPGGIFAPMLALGTIAGALFADLVALLAPTLSLAPGVFAVAAMGALFAATVRAPLTGIILVIELTGAEALALPIILTCLTATFTAEAMGGHPIYSLLLGLGDRPAPRAPGRRILAVGMILAAMVAADRLHVSRETADIAALPPTTDAGQAVPASTPDDEGTRTVTPSSQAQARTAPSSQAQIRTTDRPPEPQPHGPAIAREMPEVGSPAPLANAAPPEADRTTRVQDVTSTGMEAPAPVTEHPAPEPAPVVERVRYSIQLISFRKASSMAPFARREGVLDQARTLDADASRSSWHQVLIGDFGNRDEAEAALARLPDRLRDLKPMIRALSPEERLAPLR
ncbi:H(+)/Cl(-) exchange transporter ClcA [Thiocapsa bogorovii]|uniref:H(+)/Cl(-) exchange transporter ClcA n=1 Tax=Thiocapsa bogorovii TaxID=521689 RepID=UPI001E5C341B|nr:H(+)/Cl(-) exchange transporter ClcA [Thiocapsa bogorovii]UHD17248.1 H(+)/Cl(-) exchange transporter ClcA [Thiocapsa bogorovii]